MDKNRELYNHLADRYDLRQENHSTKVLRSKEINIIKKFSRGLVIDIGCGTGYHLSLFFPKKSLQSIQKKGITNVIGIDISEKMLKIARNKNRPLIQGSIEDLPLKNNSVDTVCCFYGTLNLVDLEKVVEETARVIRPSGKIIISAVSVKDIDKSRSSQETKIKRFRLEGRPVNMRLFEKSEIVDIFEKKGFKLERFDSIFRIQKPRWGNFQKFSFLEKIKLRIERVFPKKLGRVYFFVFAKF